MWLSSVLCAFWVRAQIWLSPRGHRGRSGFSSSEWCFHSETFSCRNLLFLPRHRISLHPSHLELVLWRELSLSAPQKTWFNKQYVVCSGQLVFISCTPVTRIWATNLLLPGQTLELSSGSSFKLPMGTSIRNSIDFCFLVSPFFIFVNCRCAASCAIKYLLPDCTNIKLKITCLPTHRWFF